MSSGVLRVRGSFLVELYRRRPRTPLLTGREVVRRPDQRRLENRPTREIRVNSKWGQICSIVRKSCDAPLALEKVTSCQLLRLHRYAALSLAPVATTAALADIHYTSLDVAVDFGSSVSVEVAQSFSLVFSAFEATNTTQGGIVVFQQRFNAQGSAGPEVNGGLLVGFKSGLPKSVIRFADGDGIGSGIGGLESTLFWGAQSLTLSKKSKTKQLNGGPFNAVDGPQDGCLGFAFADFGSQDLHYGWLSLSWDGTELTIDGYAWETEAGVSINAGTVPAPGVIGLFGLAMGAAGIRRERSF